MHLRLSAIFSNEPSCIQVNALALQARVGAHLPAVIDCNSSRNVSVALRLLLVRLERRPETVQPLYYYTRPHGPPVAYGERLVAYRRACGILFALWLPCWIVAWLVALCHLAVRRTPLRHIGLARSVDYLLQVSSRDHTFDNSRIHSDFTELKAQEEDDVCAFVRIRERQDGRALRQKGKASRGG